ncbi:MAG TPA: ParA family protein [Cellvibrio sp.]|nr:ParA family protein [Cellvibrio sp.]
MQTQDTPTKAATDSLISIQDLDAYRILVINGKGGAGKTTVSTNLAAWLAYRDQTTALLDADPQGSSSFWVTQRAPNLPPVYGLKADSHSRTTLSFQLRAPKSTQWLITDAPGGISGQALNDMVLDHHLIIIPAMPSDIDIRTTAHFIGELLLTPNMRRQRRPMAVIANRIKPQTNSWERLQKFLLSLNIPYPATLRDNQNYVRAYREGQGVVDYQQQAYLRDRADWEILIQWIDAQYAAHLQAKAERAQSEVVEKNLQVART